MVTKSSKPGKTSNSNKNNFKNIKTAKVMSNIQDGCITPDANPMKQYQHGLIIGAILLLAVIIYANTIGNGFINFDDPENIVDNLFIRQISWANIVHFFTTSVQFTYSPLVFLSFAFDYQIGQLNPAVYHFTSLLLHLFCIGLVYWLFMLLTGRVSVAAFVAVLLAIHPVNVDGISWLSTRSNVLYTFYYLGSLLLYTYYLKKDFKIKYLLWSSLLFLLAVLSKAPAVVLALVLFLWDYYYGRKWSLNDGRKRNWRLVVEKIPFFLIAVLIGILTVHFRTDAGKPAIYNIDYNLFDRFIIFCYSMADYCSKLLFPFHLSYAYGYPAKTGAFLPFLYYLAPLLLCFGLWVIYQLKVPKKVIIIGMAFFLINIIPSQAVMLMDNFRANRYAYLPYIGLYFILAGFNLRVFNFIDQWRPKIKIAWISVLVAVIIVFSVLTYQRNGLWQDTMTIFNDSIQKEPNIPYLYANRGLVECKAGDNLAALQDFNRTLELNPDYEMGYYYRGKAKEALEDYQGALDDFAKALTFKQDNPEIYYERGNVKSKLKDYQGAIAEYDQAILYRPGFSDAYNNRGNLKWGLNDLPGAIADYSGAIEYNPSFIEAYCNRGAVKYLSADYQGAVDDYSRVIAINADYAEAYYNRGLAKQRLNDESGAQNDLQRAGELGYQPGGE